MNAVELEQARRVFGGRPGLAFVAGDLTDGAVVADRPDLVVLASVIQYVPDPSTVLAAVAAGLGPGGEIHVLDSPVYEPAAVGAAPASAPSGTTPRWACPRWRRTTSTTTGGSSISSPRRCCTGPTAPGVAPSGGCCAASLAVLVDPHP